MAGLVTYNGALRPAQVTTSDGHQYLVNPGDTISVPDADAVSLLANHDWSAADSGTATLQPVAKPVVEEAWIVDGVLSKPSPAAPKGWSPIPGSSPTRTAVKTANYAAAAGDLVPCDPTGGAFTVTLPNAPADKSVVEVKIVTATAPNAVSIVCSGSDVLNRAGGSTTTSVQIPGRSATFQYDAATRIWTITQSDTPLAQLDARFTAVPRNNVYAGGEIVATNPGINWGSSSINDGVHFGGNAQSRHVMLKAQGSVRILYRNGFLTSDGPNAVTLAVKVTIGGTGGTFIPVYFRGQKNPVIDAGGWALSDPIPVDLDAGGVLYVHTYVDGGTGGYVRNFSPRYANEFSNQTAGGGIGSASDQSGVALASGATSSFGPLAIVAGDGPPTNAKAAVFGIFGDSIAAGKYDANVLGYIARALEGTYAWMSAAMPSETLTTFINNQAGYRRLPFMDGITTAICEYGINDINASARTLAQLQADVPKMTAIMKRHGAKRVVWTTILPLSTSTDTWATAANQTPGSHDSVRTAFNDWLRTTAVGAGVGIDYVFEAADLVEVNNAGTYTRNGGVWDPAMLASPSGGSLDGVHPGPAGHAKIAASLLTFIQSKTDLITP